MPKRIPGRLTIVAVALALLALAILVAVLWRPLARAEPYTRLAALAVPTRELSAAYAALEAAGLGDSISGPDNTQLIVSDFSRLLSLSLADALARISPSDPRRTPLIDALARAFFLRVGEEAWTPLYMPPGGATLREARIALQARAIPLVSSAGGSGQRGLRVRKFFWLLPLALALYLVAAKPRHDTRYRLALAFGSAPLMANASIEALLASLALIAGAMALYDGYPLREKANERLAMRIGSRRTFLARVGIYLLFALCMAALNPSIIALLAAALALHTAAFVWGPRLAALDRAGLAHKPPVFVPLRPRLLSQGYLKALRAFALSAAAGLLLGFVLGAASLESPAESVLSVAYERVTKLEGKPIELHYAYQASLTWGRLGEARWGNMAYTRSSPAEYPVGKDGEEAAPRGQIEPNALHSVLDSGYIPVVRLTKGTEAASSALPPDYKRLILCILALIPCLGLLMYGRLRLS